MKGRVLVIAGSDSGGGAGIQADIKTITAFGGFAMTAITALTVQNTFGVRAVHPAPPEIVRGQIAAVMEDLGADCWKLGMLGDAATIEVVHAEALRFARGIPIVLDPVMIAKGGASLLQADAVAALKQKLVPLAAIVTPNAPEAEALTGLRVTDLDGQKRAGEALIAAGAQAALIKGGHIDGDILRDVLVSAAGVEVFEGPRIATRATHGTGCTLASAIAARLAQGAEPGEAVRDARAYLFEAIRRAPGYGGGHGPLNHAWPFAVTSP